jgi:tRNA(Ile)-lysidine synthase
VPAAEQQPQIFPDDEIDALFAPIGTEPHIALAVSGGSDSTALMRLALSWVRQQNRHYHPGEGLAPPIGVSSETGPTGPTSPGFRPDEAQKEARPKLTVLTVDHGLRADSAVEACTVGNWARQLGLDHVILRWEGPKPSTGIQAAAREARYRLMGDWCREQAVRVLVVAHTVDDQAETVLMRLKRGAGVEGLGGMEPFARSNGIMVFRPLLGVSRQKLRQYLDSIMQTWLEDPSNENERFERTRIRKVLAGSGLEAEAIATAARRVRRAWDAVLSTTRSFLDGAIRHHEEGFGEIALPGLCAQPEEIRIRALWSLVIRYGDHGFVEYSQIENLSQWVDGGEGQARTLGGCRIHRRKATLIFGREPGRISPDPVALPHTGRLRWDNRFDIEARGPHTGLAIVPAGLAGNIERRPALPAFVQAGLPAVLLRGRLAAVPHLGLRTSSAPSELSITAKFGVEPWF